MSDQTTFQNRPVTMNEKNNLLKIEEHMYILDDVVKPNVFRNMFPYEEIPKIPVNINISKKPAKFKAKAAKKGKVNLTWTKLAKKGKTKALYAQVKNYEIQYSTDKTFATGVTKKTASKKKAKLTLKLKPKMTYDVRIRYADGKGGYSPWVLKTVKTKK